MRTTMAIAGIPPPPPPRTNAHSNSNATIPRTASPRGIGPRPVILPKQLVDNNVDGVPEKRAIGGKVRAASGGISICGSVHDWYLIIIGLMGEGDANEEVKQVLPMKMKRFVGQAVRTVVSCSQKAYSCRGGARNAEERSASAK